MLERRLPLAQLTCSGNLQPGDDAALRLTEITDRGLLLLQARADDRALQHALQRHLGLAIPAPLAIDLRDDLAILWLAPKEWLIELPLAQTDSARTTLEHALASNPTGEASPTSGASLTAVTEMSDALAGFDLEGTGAAERLASGCSLDTTPQALSLGRVARTVLADVPVILRRINASPPDRFRLWVDRSFAEHLWGWLAGGAGG